MTRKEWVEFHGDFFAKGIEISAAKNADYTGATNDPFANLRSVEQLGISTEVGLLTRMMDKMSRISSFVAKGELSVKDESAQDTLLDLANYCALFAGVIEDKKHTTRCNGI
jgi:hypothetical protein